MKAKYHIFLISLTVLIANCVAEETELLEEELDGPNVCKHAQEWVDN